MTIRTPHATYTIRTPHATYTIRTPHAIWPTAMFHCFWSGTNHYSLSWLILTDGASDKLKGEDTQRLKMGIPSIYC